MKKDVSLLPCKCGAAVDVELTSDVSDPMTMLRVRCRDCGASMPRMAHCASAAQREKLKNELIRAWNKYSKEGA